MLFRSETQKEVEFTVKRPQTVIGVNPVKWFWRGDIWFRGAPEPVELEIKTDGRYGADFTEHTIYIVGAKPVKKKNAYEFAVKKGCQWAEGKTGGKESFDAIWTGFLNIECPDGRSCTLRYDHGNSPATTAGLLSEGRGKCGAWANFFMDVIGSQGISSERIVVIPKKDQDIDLDDKIGGHKRKKTGRIKTMLVGPREAQGNPQPSRNFNDHVIVKHSGRFYDPSYHFDTAVSAGEPLHQYENETFAAYCSKTISETCWTRCNPLPRLDPKFSDCVEQHCDCRRNNPLECEVVIGN